VVWALGSTTPRVIKAMTQARGYLLAVTRRRWTIHVVIALIATPRSDMPFVMPVRTQHVIHMMTNPAR